jgi:hypothetical protein
MFCVYASTAGNCQFNAHAGAQGETLQSTGFAITAKYTTTVQALASTGSSTGTVIVIQSTAQTLEYYAHTEAALTLATAVGS